MTEPVHLCEMCRAKRPLTYRRDRDEYICDQCWDSLTGFYPQQPDDGSLYEIVREQGEDDANDQ